MGAVFRLTCRMSDDLHFVGKISQKAIVVRDGKILLVRDPSDDAIWELPGGRLHAGETPQEGLLRELKEEIGVHASIQRVVHVEQFRHVKTGQEMFLVAYEATFSPDQEIQPLDGEVGEWCWITKENLYDQHIYDNCLRALKTYFSL